MHFVIHAFSNHVGVLYNVTPIDLLAQSAVLSDGVVVACLYKPAMRHQIMITICRVLAQYCVLIQCIPTGRGGLTWDC